MSTSPSNETTQLTFSSNFAFDDADICLKTSDNVVFKVHRWPLSSASEVFRDMFTFGSGQPSAFQDVPIVDISDDGNTIDILLRFLYHQFDIPELKSMLEADRLLIAADKYNTPRISIFVKQQMTSRRTLCDSNIFIAYLIARKVFRDPKLLENVLERLLLLNWREGPGKEQLLSVLDSQRLSAAEYLTLDEMQHAMAQSIAYHIVQDKSLWTDGGPSDQQLILAVYMGNHPGNFKETVDNLPVNYWTVESKRKLRDNLDSLMTAGVAEFMEELTVDGIIPAP